MKAFVKRHKTPILTVILLGVAEVLIRALAGCTTRPDISVPVEKGAVQVAPPKIDLTLPVYFVTEHCDGTISVEQLMPDGTRVPVSLEEAGIAEAGTD